MAQLLGLPHVVFHAMLSLIWNWIINAFQWRIIFLLYFISAYIQYVSKELVLLRNNWKYLVEDLKPKGLARRMHSFGLTDYQLRTTNTRKRTSAMNDELLSKIRSLVLSSSSSCLHSSLLSSSTSESVYKTFVNSLRCSDQENAVDLVERGGGKCTTSELPNHV